MKIFEISNFSIGQVNIGYVIEVAYSLPFMRFIHGDNVKVTHARLQDKHDEKSWDKRKVLITMSSNSVPIPKEIKRFVCGGDHTRSTVRQQVMMKDLVNERKHVVKSVVIPHVLGSEFLRIRSLFTFREHDNQTVFDGKVEVHAIFPPPLNGIVESFMVEHAKYDILCFTSSLSQYLQLGSGECP